MSRLEPALISAKSDDSVSWKARLILALLFCSTLAGCFSTKTVWQEPVIVAPQSALADSPTDDEQMETSSVQTVNWETRDSGIDETTTSPVRKLGDSVAAIQDAESAYETATNRMEDPSDEIVELFLRSTVAAWDAIEITDPDRSQKEYARLTDLYHSSLVKFVQFAEEFGRRDPNKGIRIHSPTGATWLPVNLRGFAWAPEDFDDLLTIGSTDNEELGEHHCRSGWGVPLVGLRLNHRERYSCRNTAFPITCLLHPVSGPTSKTDSGHRPLVLELFEPRRYQSWTDLENRNWKLAADFTAPLTWYLHHNSSKRLHGFRDPDTDDAKLLLIEPWQQGKIPIVLLHGLLSDSTTWLNTINELSRDPEFFQHYQLLIFQYPTGKAFMSSAAEFRHEILTLFDKMWEEHRDPAIHHTVLIGHSMGGLLSRFQVTRSRNDLWQALANRDLSTVRMGNSFRNNARHVFYFAPVPYIERVVFIATPHNGSRIARQAIGRLAARLVRRNFEGEYRQVMIKKPWRFLQGLSEPLSHQHGIVGTGQSGPGCFEHA